jgi:hypothetical protein
MSPTVRTWFKDTIKSLAPDAPFQETDGVLLVQKGLPDLWSTMEFDLGANQRLSVGRIYIEREYGTCTVLFLLKAGGGPDAALLVAQAFAEAAKALYQDEVKEPSGRTATIRLENVGPPNCEPYEDGNWLVVSVACVYSYDAIRGDVLTETLPAT